MTAADDLLLNGPAQPLVVRGRYQLNGESFQRVTNFVKTVADTYNLDRYQRRMVALGMAARPDLVAMAASLTTEDKGKLNDLAEQAIEAAKGSAKANLGTALHAFAERVDRGEVFNIPAPWDADIAAYRAAMDANNIKVDPALMERVIVHRGYRVAGRFDRIVTIDGHDRPYIADVKTGGIEWGLAEIAAQLHTYATADEMFDEATNSFVPMVDVDRDRAIIIHLPVGEARCELLFVDLEPGRQVAELCAAVRDQRRVKITPSPVSAARAPTVAERIEWLKGRALNLRDRHPDAFADLVANWPGAPTFKQGGHTIEHVELIAFAVTAAEAKHDVPFFDVGDPTNAPVDKQTVAGLVARMKALPDDALDALKLAAKGAGVPNVSGRKFTVAHLPVIVELLDDAERVVTERAANAAA